MTAKSIRARTGYIPGGEPCPDCGKKRWQSKADAKAMAKRTPGGHELSAYRCGNYWHLGHIPTVVKHGDATRADIYPVKHRRKDAS